MQQELGFMCDTSPVCEWPLHSFTVAESQLQLMFLQRGHSVLRQGTLSDCHSGNLSSMSGSLQQNKVDLRNANGTSPKQEVVH